MSDENTKKDDKAKSADATKKPEGAREQPISDADAQAISGGLASVKWDKK